MRIVIIAAGAAGAYCGACKRDAALARELLALGHDVSVVPLYTPLVLDEPDPGTGEVFYSGASVWLEQRSRLFRTRLPVIDRLLASPWLLGALSRFGIETRASELGPMTVSVLRGSEGAQAKELARLAGFLEGPPRPDVIHLTNTLLAGTAPELSRRLNCRIVASLSGEDAFLGELPEPHRGEAVAALRSSAEAVDAFIAPHESYADEMSPLLAVDRRRIRVVRTGIDVGPFEGLAAGAEARGARPFRIGFFSRITREKGIDILFDAFGRLDRARPGEAQLAVGGQARGRNDALLDELRRKLADSGSKAPVELLLSPQAREKVDFLGRLSVMALPSRITERLAIACIEAMVAGVPLIVPDRGVFPEMIALTGGGILIPAEDTASLVRALLRFMDEPELLRRMARSAWNGAREHYSSRFAAASTLKVYEEVLSTSRAAQ